MATADPAAASYFNPALLGLFGRDEDTPGAKRLVAPVVSARATDVTDELMTFEDRNYEAELRRTIDQFNVRPAQDTAAAVASTAQDLRRALDGISNRPLRVDGFAGLVVAVPSKGQGGAFFSRGRVVGSGMVAVSESDARLLDDYVDGLTFVATEGVQGRAVPELFDDSGRLLDLSNTLSSQVVARGAIVTEVGIAVGDRARWREHEFLWGVAPKVQAVSTFDYRQTVYEGTVRASRDFERKFRLNADVGAAWPLQGRWRIGAVVRDVRAWKVDTRLGNQVAVDPQWRAGAAYLLADTTVAVDLDLLPNDPAGVGSDSQWLAAGLEKQLGRQLFLRAGYQHDLQDAGQTGLATFGVGVARGGFGLDVAVAGGRNQLAAAAQLRFQF